VSSPAAAAVHGFSDARFAALREAFDENLACGADAGAAVSVYVDGEKVVDLWGGWANSEEQRPWNEDTITTVWSVTKAFTAVCAHRMVDAGLLDLDAPVAAYWPEFGQNGKGDIPVHMLLSHRSGLYTTGRKLAPDDLYDWDTMTAALAETEPFWEPGTRHGYHGITYGWLVGEVVRRVSGKSLGTVFREQVAEPLGMDSHIGTGPEHDARIATMYEAQRSPGEEKERATRMAASFAALPERWRQAAGNVVPGPNAMNSERWRRAEMPAVNAHTDARSLAKMYGALATGGSIDGYELLTPESVRRAATEQAAGPDAVIGFPTRFGLGFWLSRPEAPMGPNPNTFGHPGLGGAVGFADPDRKIGFGYVMNQMKPTLLVGGTGENLVNALYASLA
jgi:CubicO group peptidase (beta-lactamase class C family)